MLLLPLSTLTSLSKRSPSEIVADIMACTLQIIPTTIHELSFIIKVREQSQRVNLKIIFSENSTNLHSKWNLMRRNKVEYCNLVYYYYLKY